MMPPQLEHGWLAVDRRHRVDALRKVIHSLNAQRALVFMNFQHRLKVSNIFCQVVHCVDTCHSATWAEQNGVRTVPFSSVGCATVE